MLLIFAVVSLFFFSFIYAEFYDCFPSTNFAFIVIMILLSLVILSGKLGCLFDFSLAS